MRYSVTELIMLRKYFLEKYNQYIDDNQLGQKYLDIIEVIDGKLLNIGENFQ
jgi:hypothetical protein